MRNKFSDLIKKGVASFNYTPISKDIPEQDPICRTYNNLFSMLSDTHMSCLDDGTRIITGHIIRSTRKWNTFCSSLNNINIGEYWCLDDFLYKLGLERNIGVVNGDIVAIITPKPTPGVENPDDMYKIPVPTSVTTTESRIPMSPLVITTSNNMMHVNECFGGDVNDVCKKLNESSYIRGNKWIPSQRGIIGLVDNTIYVIDNPFISEAKG